MGSKEILIIYHKLCNSIGPVHHIFSAQMAGLKGHLILDCNKFKRNIAERIRFPLASLDIITYTEYFEGKRFFLFFYNDTSDKQTQI